MVFRLFRAGVCAFFLLLSTPAGAELIAHWKLDEPEGTEGVDSILDSGPTESHPGTPDFPIDTSPVTLEVEGATEESGTAASFMNGVINVPYDEALNPESFTFCVWAKANSTAGFQSVVTSRYDMGPAIELYGYVLYNDGNGNWAFWTGHGGPAPWHILGGPPVEIDVWHHLTISFDAETMTKTLYVNGEEVASATDQGYVPNSGMDLHIGGGGDMGDQFRFVGLIDDVALFDEALSQEDVQDIMENGIGEGPPPGPLFTRGDANDDGNRNIADAISILGYLFGGDAAPTCQDAADANDDGNLNIADAITILGHLFGGTGDLAAPFPGCGEDPTDTDTLPKCEYTHCP